MSIGQKQHVASLKFFLYDRPLHPELFEIYHGRNINRKEYQAQIWVTGCTHMIGFYRQKQSLCEVIADRGSELPSRGLLLEMPFKGEKEHQFKRSLGINYMMNFQAESMSAAVYAKTHHDLARLGAKRGLFVPFPTWRTHGLMPFTFIDYQTNETSLHVFAFHAFPEDLTVIKTQSIFELG